MDHYGRGSHARHKKEPTSACDTCRDSSGANTVTGPLFGWSDLGHGDAFVLTRQRQQERLNLCDLAFA